MKTKYPTEYEEQCAVIRWARMMAETEEPRLELLHGDASGVRVPIGLAMKLKRAGAVKGWPDLFLPITTLDSCGFTKDCGLFIELKREKGGVVSDDQAKIHKMLRDQGYKVEVCHGAGQAIWCIKQYLGMD